MTLKVLHGMCYRFTILLLYFVPYLDQMLPSIFSYITTVVCDVYPMTTRLCHLSIRHTHFSPGQPTVSLFILLVGLNYLLYRLAGP